MIVVVVKQVFYKPSMMDHLQVYELSLLYYVSCLIDPKIEIITKNVCLIEENQKIMLQINATTTTSYYEDAMVQNTSDY